CHLEPADPVLTHIKQMALFEDRASFVGYVNDFKTDKTRIFCSFETTKFVAVFDYHDKDGDPAYCHHVAHYTCPVSEQWAAWCLIDGRPVAQKLFADFLE